MRKFTLLFAAMMLANVAMAEITMTELWKFTTTTTPAVTAVDVKSGIAVFENKLYMPTRTADAQLALYDATTGTFTKYLANPAQQINAYGGDVAVDANGNVYACNVIISGTGEFYIYKWAGDDAIPTKFISTTAHGGSGANRVGYGLDVRIDKDGNGIVLAPVAGTDKVLCWTVANNVLASQDPEAIVTETTIGTTPRVHAISDTQFWVDGNGGLPTLCTITSATTATSVVWVTGENPLNVSVSGVDEFTYNGKRYAVFGANNHGVSGSIPKHSSLLLELDAEGVGITKEYGYFPAEGLGAATDYSHFTQSATWVTDECAFIYIMGGANGIAAYKLVDSSIGVGLDKEEISAVRLHETMGGVRIDFAGEAMLQVYNVNGMLINEAKAYDGHEFELQTGVYIIRVNGEAHKFVK